MGDRKKARTAAGSGSSGDGGGDRITALPLELRAHIASFLSFDEIVQLTVLSRPWCYIHHHTPVVKIYLDAFLYCWDLYINDNDDGEAPSVRGLLDNGSILGLRVALGRRAQEASASRVDTLRLDSDFGDRRMRRHADRIIALADARAIRIRAPLGLRSVVEAVQRDAWTLELPPAARDLEVIARSHILPAIAGPGAAALQKLRLDGAVVAEWPARLPCLVSLSLNNVTVEAAFAPGAWCPLLDELYLFCCKIEQARVDIRLPRLRFLDMDFVDVAPRGGSLPDGTPYGVVNVDTPELVAFGMETSAGCSADYKSFALRAPRLRRLCWYNQFAERMVVDVGRPGSVKVGQIKLRSVYFRKIECFMEQMMRMLQGLLPNIAPENLADVARPYLTLGECCDYDDDDEDEPKDEQLTCNLEDLIMSQGHAVSTVINNGDVPEAEDDAVAATEEEASAEGCTRTQVGPRRSTRPKRPSTRTSGPEWKT